MSHRLVRAQSHRCDGVGLLLGLDAVGDGLQEVVVEQVGLQTEHLAEQLAPSDVGALCGNQGNWVNIVFKSLWMDYYSSIVQNICLQ